MIKLFSTLSIVVLQKLLKHKMADDRYKIVENERSKADIRKYISGLKTHKKWEN